MCSEPSLNTVYYSKILAWSCEVLWILFYLLGEHDRVIKRLGSILVSKGLLLHYTVLFRGFEMHLTAAA